MKTLKIYQRQFLQHFCICSLLYLSPMSCFGQATDVTVFPGSVIQSFEDENVQLIINFGQTPAVILQDENVQLAINLPNLIVEEATTPNLEYEKIVGITVSPNPFDYSILMTRTGDLQAEHTISILNQAGELITQNRWEPNSLEIDLDMASLSAGFYLIQIIDSKTQKRGYYKVVKQ